MWYKAVLVSCILVVFSPVQAVELALFGDASYAFTLDNADPHSFFLGTIDLNVSQDLSDTTQVTADLLFHGNQNDYKSLVDRVIISRSFTDYFNVSFGRIHTPIGFWNQNFHHGAYIQDTVSRPVFLDYETSGNAILPTHIVGLQANGQINKWGYQFAIANSNGIDSTINPQDTPPTELEVIDGKDPSKEKTFAMRMTYGPQQWLQETGIFALFNNVTELGNFDPNNTNSSSLKNYGDILFNQQVFGFDLRTNQENWYLFSEFYYIYTEELATNTNQTGYNATAFYIQGGYRQSNKIIYVARFEDMNFDPDDNYYKLLGVEPQSRYILALNYRIEDSNGIHIEFNHTDKTQAVNKIILQWYFALL